MTNCIEDPDSAAGWHRYNRYRCRCPECVYAVRLSQNAYLRKARAAAKELRDTLPPGTPLPFCKGTQSTYASGCRCGACSEAAREYDRGHTARASESARALRDTLPPGTPLPFCKGTIGTYKKGCRCDRCKAASAGWYREYRARKAQGR